MKLTENFAHAQAVCTRPLLGEEGWGGDANQANISTASNM